MSSYLSHGWFQKEFRVRVARAVPYKDFQRLKTCSELKNSLYLNFMRTAVRMKKCLDQGETGFVFISITFWVSKGIGCRTQEIQRMALSEAGLVGSWVLVARAVPYKEFQRLLSHKIVPILNKVPFPFIFNSWFGWFLR